MTKAWFTWAPIFSLTAALFTAGCGGDNGNGTGGGASASSSASSGGNASSSTSGTGGAGTSSSASGTGGAGGGNGHVQSIVGVGYGGIRIVSRDLGKTWSDKTEFAMSGGDDENLLRGIAYGNGTWVATGWKRLTSPDGIQWTEQAPTPGCGLMEGVAFGNGVFIGTCGENAWRSTDGVSWTEVGKVGGTKGHTYVFFRDGKFAASGDSGQSFTSPDGVTWSDLPGITRVRYCEGAFKSEMECHGATWIEDGVWLKVSWGGHIERSADGVSWMKVYSDASENTLYNEFAFAVGMSPP